MQSKIRIVTVLAVSIIIFIIASAAHSADWSITKDEIKFDCKVDVQQPTLFGQWLYLLVTYDFCEGHTNYIKFYCSYNTEGFTCAPQGARPQYSCDYHFDIRFKLSNVSVILNPGTENAQRKVCSEIFRQSYVDKGIYPSGGKEAAPVWLPRGWK